MVNLKIVNRMTVSVNLPFDGRGWRQLSTICVTVALSRQLNIIGFRMRGIFFLEVPKIKLLGEIV